MYAMTAQDRLPRTLFGRVYFWSADDAGRLHLISLAKLTAAVEALRGSDA